MKMVRKSGHENLALELKCEALRLRDLIMHLMEHGPTGLSASIYDRKRRIAPVPIPRTWEIRRNQQVVAKVLNIERMLLRDAMAISPGPDPADFDLAFVEVPFRRRITAHEELFYESS